MKYNKYYYIKIKDYFSLYQTKVQNGILEKWFHGNLTIYFVHVLALLIAYSFFLQFIGNAPAITFISICTHSSANDSWVHMIRALEFCQQFPDAKIYKNLLIENGVKIQYPPTSLLLFDIPERIFGWNYLKIAKIFDALSLVSVFLIAIFTSKILKITLEKYNFKNSHIIPIKTPVVQHVIILIVTLLYYPLIKSLHLGQIQTMLTMLSTLVLYSYLSDRKKIAGFCIGLICLVKPQLGLLFVWGIIRKEWAMVISGGITIISLLLLSISFYGFHNHWDYLSALSFLSKHGESYCPNQSMNGLMHRLLFNGNNLDWLPASFPPFHIVVYVSTLISSIIFIFTGFFGINRNNKPDVIELSLVMLCATMASPIAWEHHYSILLPIFVLLSPFMLYFYQHQKWKIFLFIMAFIVASQQHTIFYCNKIINSRLNILESYLFFAALVILIFLFFISKKIRNEKTY